MVSWPSGVPSLSPLPTSLSALLRPPREALDAARARGELLGDLELLDAQNGPANGARRLAAELAGRPLAVLERREVLPERHRHRASVLVVDEDVSPREAFELLDLLRGLAEGGDRFADPVGVDFVTCHSCPP